MVSDSGKTVSPWLATVEMPRFPTLQSDLSADVCVVGAGITGITTAYLLAQEGRKVVVIDDGPVGGGETGRTTAHIASALDDRYFHLEKLFGEEGARTAAQSHSAAIRKISEIVAAEKIDCDFVTLDGFLFEPPGRNPANIDREYTAARRAGLQVAIVDSAPAPFDTGKALKFSGQAQFHPLKYLRGLVGVIQAKGGQIFTGTRAMEMEGSNPAKVKTKNGQTITAGAIVVATNTPVNDWVVIHSKQAAYRTYVIGLEVPAVAVPPILLWDDDDPYHYVRLQKGGDTADGKDLLIVGGEDHKTGQKEEGSAPFGRLEKWARDRYLIAGEVAFRWSGQVMEPVDSLAYIGRNPADEENIYVATGDSGNGMTHGTIAGILITDLIMGRKNPWEELYDPRRKTLRSAAEYAKENLNVATQYTDFLTAGEIRSADELRPGFGAIMRHGKDKLAVYKDENGAVHEMSAVCPHLKCIVKWNHVEKSWDCPCHGSRFNADGKVLNGPALTDLEPVATAVH